MPSTQGSLDYYQYPSLDQHPRSTRLPEHQALSQPLQPRQPQHRHSGLSCWAPGGGEASSQHQYAASSLPYPSQRAQVWEESSRPRHSDQRQWGGGASGVPVQRFSPDNHSSVPATACTVAGDRGGNRTGNAPQPPCVAPREELRALQSLRTSVRESCALLDRQQTQLIARLSDFESKMRAAEDELQRELRGMTCAASAFLTAAMTGARETAELSSKLRTRSRQHELRAGTKRLRAEPPPSTKPSSLSAKRVEAAHPATETDADPDETQDTDAAAATALHNALPEQTRKRTTFG